MLLGDSPVGLIARIAGLTALLLVVAGVATWAALDRTVTVTVDGEARQVRFVGTGVDTALAAAGVTVEDGDSVIPGQDQRVGDGDTIEVRHARPITLTIDGVTETHMTTGLTVDEAIAALGLRLDGARMSTSRSAGIGRGGLTLTVVTPKSLTLVVSGVATPVTSTDATVADLLASQSVGVDADDRVAPAPATPVSEGLVVTVNRVETRDETTTVAIPPGAGTVEDPDLPTGTTRVTTAGRAGVATVTVRVVTVDGVEESREELSRTITTPAVDRVTTRGAGPAATAAAQPADGGTAPGTAAPVPVAGGDVASLNWAALAQCESGGNPTIVSANGLYSGLYQFDAQTWRSLGGTGTAGQAPAAEQTARAQQLYEQRGAAPWPTCGKRLFS